MKYSSIIIILGILAWIFIPAGSIAFAATPTPAPSATPSPTPTPEKKSVDSNILGQQLLWGVDDDGNYHPLKCTTDGILWMLSK